MLPFFTTDSPLDNAKIIDLLAQLRSHSFAESSDFSVAALLEIVVDQHYFYVGGVNVESMQLNRLSTHAEQNAIAVTQALLGTFAKFERIWVMGGPRETNQQNMELGATAQINLCGHCRQILLPFAAKNAQVFTVTISGELSAPQCLEDLLPNAFYEKDLTTRSHGRKIKQENPLNTFKRWTQLMQIGAELNADEIHLLMKLFHPKILNKNYETSGILSCVFKLANQTYVPGVLVQDAAFLTSEAVFAALAFAVTLYGSANVDIREVYLCVRNAKQFALGSVESTLLNQFSNGNYLLSIVEAES